MMWFALVLWLTASATGTYWLRGAAAPVSIYAWLGLLFVLSLASTLLAGASIRSTDHAPVSANRAGVHALQQLKFFSFGALILALPVAFVRNQEHRATWLLVIAAVLAWIGLYRGQWAQGWHALYARSAASSFNGVLKALQRSYFQQCTMRAQLQFFWLGVSSLLAIASVLVWALVVAVKPEWATIRNWLAFALLLTPGMSFWSRELFAKASFDLSSAQPLSAKEPSKPPSSSAHSLDLADHPLRLNTNTGEYDLPSMRAQDSREFQALQDISLLSTRNVEHPQAEPLPQRLIELPEPDLQALSALRRTSTVELEQQLRRAVQAADLDGCERALSAGADVSHEAQAGDADQRSLLTIAASAGQLKLIKRLLVAGADINAMSRGLNPLLAATRDSWSGRFDVVMALLSNGANVNVCDPQGQTPLHGAARSIDVALLQLLLDAGAKLEALDQEGYTPMLRAVQANRFDNVVWFFKHGAKSEPESSTSMRAQSLALIGAEINEPDPKLLHLIMQRSDLKARDQFGRNALHLCAMEDAVEFADCLLQARFNLEQKDSAGATALMLASKHSSVRVAKRLLQAGVQIDSMDGNGQSALHIAATALQASKEMAELLRLHGASLTQKNIDGLTPAELALKIGRWELARVLSPEHELPAVLTDALEASEGDSLDADAHTSHLAREQLVVQACEQRRLSAVQMLMKLGSIDAHSQQRALMALGNDLDAQWLQTLLVAGHPSLDKPEPILTQLARQLPAPNAAIAMLLKHGASVAADSAGDTALTLICGAAAELEGSVPPLLHEPPSALIDALVRAGTPVDHRDNEQRTALSYAVEWCSERVVERLLANGAQPNDRDTHGQTPLLRALPRKDALEKATLLLRGGADPNLLSRDGRSARAIALAANQTALADLLAWPDRAHPGRALSASDLSDAARVGDIDGIKRMLQLGLELEALDDQGVSALAHAAGRGDRSLFEYLLSRGARPGGLPDLDARITALGAAVSGRHFDLIRRLVDVGAPLDQRFGDLTALSLACGNLDAECVGLLITLGATVNPSYSSNVPLLTPWHATLQAVLAGGDFDTGHKLLQMLVRAGVDPDSPDSAGRSGVMILLSGNQSKVRFADDGIMIDMLKLLLSLGANALQRDNHGRGALHWCCRHGLFNAADVLLDFGADPAAVDEFRKLPVDMASTLNRHDFLALFRGG